MLTPLLPSTAPVPGGGEPGTGSTAGQPSDPAVFRAALAVVAGLVPPCSAASGEPAGAAPGASTGLWAGVFGLPLDGSTTGAAPAAASPDGPGAGDPAGVGTPGVVGGAELALLAQLAGLQGVGPRVAVPVSVAPAAPLLTPPAAAEPMAAGRGAGSSNASPPVVGVPGASFSAMTAMTGTVPGTPPVAGADRAGGLERPAPSGASDGGPVIAGAIAGSAADPPSPSVSAGPTAPAGQTSSGGASSWPADINSPVSTSSPASTPLAGSGKPVSSTSVASPATGVATTAPQASSAPPAAVAGAHDAYLAPSLVPAPAVAGQSGPITDRGRLRGGGRSQDGPKAGAATGRTGSAGVSAPTAPGREQAQPLMANAEGDGPAPVERSAAVIGVQPSAQGSAGQTGDAQGVQGSDPRMPAPAGPAAAGGAPPAASGPGRTDTAASPVTVPDQVLSHLASVRALREGGHRTVLRLEPEHLGEVTVTVDVRAGAVRMAVSGGTAALAAVRDGLQHLRTSLADSGLDLGDVALRPGGAPAVPAATPSAAPGSDGRDQAPGARPDAGAGAGATGGEQRPAREQPGARPVDAPESPSAARGQRTPVATDLGPDAATDTTGRRTRLDVRV